MSNNNNNKTNLSKNEIKRIEKFNIRKENLILKNYIPKELIISINKANIFAMILMILTAVVLFLIYSSLHNVKQQLITYLDNISILKYILHIISFFVILLLLVVIHELLHGFTWAIFSSDHFKSIEFGYLKEKATPYCYCYTPLTKFQYLIGCLMPLFILGIIPAAYAILKGNLIVLLFSIIMISAAAGDILVSYKLFKYNTNKNHILIFDHPIEAGLYIFEK